MFVVCVFNHAATAATNKGIAFDDYGVAKLVQCIDPGFSGFVVPNLIRRVGNSLGIVLIGFPEVIPIQGSLDASGGTRGIHIRLTDPGIARPVIPRAIALPNTDIITRCEMGAFA